ncbi:helix-hairpin-helix domain-containing protein [Neobacillus sp. MER 74]|uniref:helix-hairpin-helix domain-containing protein n=1 Tax=Neobacillus sp. MER 74 TaxID=2939566 RepID=UPI00203E9DB5|nr:helix-hairpin-helix domain-containing protein [Neobacillus sp. MER 74]MCM3114898.1 helix-hairpin-helix domain-containing protein [Neobacillus sp. MER 74]
MKDWLIEHKISVLLGALLTLGGIYYFYVSDYATTSPVNTLSMEGKVQENVGEGGSTQSDNQPELPEKIMVDVKGQIKQPGVYQANTGERVIDVISRAGGLTDKADQGMVNFAEHVKDEMIIYIPAKGEEGLSSPITSSGNPASSVGSQNEAKININKADETELQNLPGIGPAKAAAIIEYRNTSGPFKTVEDLKNISGIGDKTFEKLKDLIAI